MRLAEEEGGDENEVRGEKREGEKGKLLNWETMNLSWLVVLTSMQHVLRLCPIP